MMLSLFPDFDLAALPVVKGSEHQQKAEEENIVLRNTSYSIRNGKQVRVKTENTDVCFGLLHFPFPFLKPVLPCLS